MYASLAHQTQINTEKTVRLVRLPCLHVHINDAWPDPWDHMDHLRVWPD